MLKRNITVSFERNGFLNFYHTNPSANPLNYVGLANDLFM